jgi:23S rRNA pseudouridine1911/1915/1917 synthase
MSKPKPSSIEFPTGEKIPILYEDRAVMAIDKPRGWMLTPISWQKTDRNLQAALVSSIAAGDFWARARGLKFLRFVHRLDADTSGILLLAKSPGAVRSYGALFENRGMEKIYLAVVHGTPDRKDWVCRLKLAADSKRVGKMRIDAHHGQIAETHFRVLQTREKTALLEARPVTGRTHQIRVHLAEDGFPIVGDELYGRSDDGRKPMGLRAICLSYADPFDRRRIQIRAPFAEFAGQYGFDTPVL